MEMKCPRNGSAGSVSSFQKISGLAIWSGVLSILIACSQSVDNPKFVVGDNSNAEAETTRYALAFEEWLQKYKSESSSRNYVSSDGTPLFSGVAPCQVNFPGAPTLEGAGETTGAQDSIATLNAQIRQVESDPTLMDSWEEAQDSEANFESPQCSTREASAFSRSRMAGTQTNPLAGPCIEPYPIPCILNAGPQGKSPGCCRKCRAPVCYGLYSNGVVCTSRNTPGRRWQRCSGRPKQPILAWICPCT